MTITRRGASRTPKPTPILDAAPNFCESEVWLGVGISGRDRTEQDDPPQLQGGTLLRGYEPNHGGTAGFSLH